MPYVVFALKWRPKNFDEIIGQDHIVTTLRNALQHNRLAHAYLFAGPRGVGKTSTARILAKAINCKEGPTTNPCGTCPSCIEISQGTGLDVIEIDGASNRGIDEIRVLRESVKFAPVRSRYKVYIIDEVHQITADGFNALLKTLEEPPEYVKFIFATTQPNKVMSTILSRCQRLDFRRISVMEIVGQLERIVAKEGVDVDKEALLAIAKASDGALRDAESILDQLVSFAQGKVTLAEVVSMLGLVEQETLFAVADRIIAKDARGALELFDRAINEGRDTGVFLSNLIEHFRNLMVAKIARADSHLIDLPQEVCSRLLEQSQAFAMEELFGAFNTLIGAQEMAKRLDSARIPLEIALVKLAHDKKGDAPAPSPPVRPHPAHESRPQPPSSDAAADARPPVKAGPPEAESGVPTPQEHKDEPQASLEKVKEVWLHVIENLGRVKMSAATYLNEGVPVKVEHNVLTVAFPRNLSLHKESLERKETKLAVEKTVSELVNARVRVNFVLSREEAAKKEGASNPFIKSVLDSFGGRVIAEE